MKIIAAVTFYKFSEDIFFKNLSTYFSHVDTLVIWLNSDISETFKETLLKYKNVTLFNIGGPNVGIGSAFNSILNTYSDYDLFLTLDQDSGFKDFKSYLNEVKSIFTNNSSVGAIGLNFNDYPSIKKTKEVDFLITSGTIYLIKCLKEVGLFNEYFFIDAIDEEISLKLKSVNYSLLKLDYHLLHHQFGESQTVRFFFRKLVYMRHSSFRIYYITRNHFILLLTYKMPGSFFKHVLYSYFIKEPMMIIFYDKEKIKKISAFIKGLIDALKYFVKYKNK